MNRSVNFAKTGTRGWTRYATVALLMSAGWAMPVLAGPQDALARVQAVYLQDMDGLEEGIGEEEIAGEEIGEEEIGGGGVAGAEAQSLATLDGVGFYDAAYADEVLGEQFDPFHYWEAHPASVTFGPAGELEIDWSQETEHCSFSVEEAESMATLQLDCAGSTRTATWLWTPEGRVSTTLLGDDARELVRLEASFEEIRSAYDEAFTRVVLESLAGTYRTDAGVELTISQDAQAKLEGKSNEVQVLECLMVGEEGVPRVVCLKLGTDGPVFAVLEEGDDVTLLEGAIPQELYPDGRPFESKANGRTFDPVQSEE